MGVLSDDDLVRMRARARHRLFGALALVVMLVVGVPLLFDRHEPVPPAASDDGDGDHGGEAARPPQPSSVTTPGSGTAPAEATAPAATAVAQAGPPATGTPAGSPATAGSVAPVAPSAPAQVRAPAGAGSPSGDGDAVNGDAGKAAGSRGLPEAAVKGEPPRAAELGRPQAVPDTVPPLSMAAPGQRAAGTQAPPAKGRPAPAPAEESAAEPPAPHGWFVQFGMFAEAPRAHALSQQLEAQGIHVHDEVVHGPRGRFTLVRAGPFPSRAAADELLARARGLGENAFLGHQ